MRLAPADPSGANFYHTTLQDCPCEFSSGTVLMDPVSRPTLPHDFMPQVSTHNSRPHACPGTSQSCGPRLQWSQHSGPLGKTGADSRTTPADVGLQPVAFGPRTKDSGSRLTPVPGQLLWRETSS